MGEALSDIARKVLAVAVLVVAAYILFKIVIGFVAGIAVIFVAIVRRHRRRSGRCGSSDP